MGGKFVNVPLPAAAMNKLCMTYMMRCRGNCALFPSLSNRRLDRRVSIMSDSHKYSVSPGAEPEFLDISISGQKQHGHQLQPPETTTEATDEQTSSVPRPAQHQSDRKFVMQSAAMDDRNNVRMPSSEHSPAAKRRCKVRQSCQKREL